MSVEIGTSLLSIVLSVAAIVLVLRKNPLRDPLKVRVEILETELSNAYVQMREMREHMHNQQIEINYLVDYIQRLTGQVRAAGMEPVQPGKKAEV